jgi:hypothetical protein
VLLDSSDGHIAGVHCGVHLVTSVNYAKPVSLAFYSLICHLGSAKTNVFIVLRIGDPITSENSEAAVHSLG